MKSLVAIIAMALLAAGCSSGGGNGSGDKAPGNGSSKITSNGIKALTGQTAIFEAGQALAKNKNTQAGQFVRDAVQKMSAHDTSETVAVKSKSALVQKSVQTGACTIGIENPQNSSGSRSSLSTGTSPLKMKISGRSCPLEMNMEISLVGMDGRMPCGDASSASASCQFNTQAKMTYQVLDEKLAEQLEVRSGQIAIVIETEQVMPGPNANQMGMDMKHKGNFDLKAVDLGGQVHLISGKQEFNLKMTMPVQQPNGVSMSQGMGGGKEDLQYFQQNTGVSSSFNFVATFSGSSVDERYFIDGNSVTKEAYIRERTKFANSMMEPKVGMQNEQSVSSESELNPHQPIELPPPQQGTTLPQPGTPPGPIFPPSPQPSPADKKWACVVKDYSTDDLFIGYGPVEFAAKSKAKQICQSAVANPNCDSSARCEQQEENSQAWFCEVRHYVHGKIYNSAGASKIEASYLARKSCVVAHPGTAYNCTTPSNGDCVHQ